MAGVRCSNRDEGGNYGCVYVCEGGLFLCTVGGSTILMERVSATTPERDYHLFTILLLYPVSSSKVSRLNCIESGKKMNGVYV